MSSKFGQQKAALTRAIKSGDYDKVVAATRKAIKEWETLPEFGYWPDDWAKWQRALDDVWFDTVARHTRGKLDTLPNRVDMDDL